MDVKKLFNRKGLLAQGMSHPTWLPLDATRTDVDAGYSCSGHKVFF
jgi:hypothetical protein